MGNIYIKSRTSKKVGSVWKIPDIVKSYAVGRIGIFAGHGRCRNPALLPNPPFYPTYIRDCVNVEIIPAGRRDACDFYRLEAKCFGMDENPDTLYFWVPILEYQHCYKAVCGGSLVGGIVSMPTRDKRWYINSLFVDPRYRRRKIASMLLGKIVNIARCDIVLDVKTDRPHLIQFYRERGFKKEKLSVGHYYDGSDRLIMRKRQRRR